MRRVGPLVPLLLCDPHNMSRVKDGSPVWLGILWNHIKEPGRQALHVWQDMSKRKGEKGIDLSSSLDTFKCFGRERPLEVEDQAGGRRNGVITYCPACPGRPESLGGVTSSRAALLALVLPAMASRPGAVLFLITEGCRGAPWVGLVSRAPKPRGPQHGTQSRTHTYVLWRPV